MLKRRFFNEKLMLIINTIYLVKFIQSHINNCESKLKAANYFMLEYNFSIKTFVKKKRCFILGCGVKTSNILILLTFLLEINFYLATEV